MTHPDETSLKTQRQLVTFQIDGHTYGIDIAHVQEVVRLQIITRMPHTPAYLEGVMNLRGGILAVIDVRRRLGLAHQTPTNTSRVVVVELRGKVAGLLVDEVGKMIRFGEDMLEVLTEHAPALAFALGTIKTKDHPVTLLDVDALLYQGTEQEKFIDSNPD